MGNSCGGMHSHTPYKTWKVYTKNLHMESHRTCTILWHKRRCSMTFYTQILGQNHTKQNTHKNMSGLVQTAFFIVLAQWHTDTLTPWHHVIVFLLFVCAWLCQLLLVLLVYCFKLCGFVYFVKKYVHAWLCYVYVYKNRLVFSYLTNCHNKDNQDMHR